MRTSELDLVWGGPSAKAYAALFGKFLKVTDVYRLVYGKTGNTGRVSVAVSDLGKAGFVEAVTHPSTTWRLYTATMKPVVADAKLRGAEFSDPELKLIAEFLGCSSGKAVESAKGGLVALSKEGFVPPLAQVRSALCSAVVLGVAYYSSRTLEGKRMSDYLTALRGALDGKGSPVEASPFSGFSTKLSIQARSEVGSGKSFESTLLYRAAVYSCHPAALGELVQAATSSG